MGLNSIALYGLFGLIRLIKVKIEEHQYIDFMFKRGEKRNYDKRNLNYRKVLLFAVVGEPSIGD